MWRERRPVHTYIEKRPGALQGSGHRNVVAGDQVEIASGLNPGELLVVRGGFNLKDNDKVIISGGTGQVDNAAFRPFHKKTRACSGHDADPCCIRYILVPPPVRRNVSQCGDTCGLDSYKISGRVSGKR